MAAPKPLTSSLDMLQEMVNAILVQTGSIFSEPTNYNTRSIVHSNNMLQDSMPRSLNAFHNALDQLEEEIIQAKSVLRRDLAACRKPAVEPLVTNDSDTIMRDQPAGATEEQSTEANPDANPEADPVKIEHLAGTPAEAPGENANAENGTLAKGNTIDSTSKPASPSQTDNKDADSIFGDPQGDATSQTEAIEEPKNANEVALNATPIDEDLFGPSTAKLQDDENGKRADTNNFTTAEVEALLPGLENYAGDNGEPEAFDGMGDFGDFGSSEFDTGSGMQGMDPGGLPDGLMQGETTNFDDLLFDYGDFGVDGEENGEEAKGAPDGTNFDENFFNLD